MGRAREAAGRRDLTDPERTLAQQSPAMGEADGPVLGGEAQSALLEEQAVEVTRADRGETCHGLAAEGRLDRLLHRLDDRQQSRMVDAVAFDRGCPLRIVRG